MQKSLFDLPINQRKKDEIVFPFQFKCKCGKPAHWGKLVNIQLAIKKEDKTFLGEWFCEEHRK